MAEQLFQIGIKGLIRDEQGRILLLKVPEWNGNPDHWDMPGGRMDPGETFMQTLSRELKEEIGVDYSGDAKHIATVLSNITIPVGDIRVPLVLMAYEVDLPNGTPIVLDGNDTEKEYEWTPVKVAAERLERKYPMEFCKAVAAL